VNRPPRKLDDPRRIRVFEEANLANRLPDPAFDIFTRLVAQSLNVPIAVISTVTPEHEFRKSVFGHAHAQAANREVPHNYSFCKNVVDTSEALIINDVSADPRFERISAMQGLGVVAYAGVPIIAADEVIGACCAIDHVPRAWNEREIQILADISAAVSTEIEYRRAVRARERSEEQFRLMFAAAPVAITVTTIDGARFLEVNEQYVQIVGYTREELIGRSAFDIGLWIDPEQRRAVGEQLAKHDRVDSAEIKIRTKNGAVRTFEISVTRIQFADEPCVLSILSDVTARKAAEQRLRESEQRFRQLAQHLPQLFWMRDAKSGRLIYLSPAFEKIWGRPLEDSLDDKMWMNAIHPDDRESVRKILLEMPNERWDLDYRIVRPDGAVRWIANIGFPIFDDAGEVYRYAGISEDITDRKLAAEALLEREHHYRRLVTTSPDGIYVLDSQGCFTELNPAGEAIIRRRAEEVIGRHFREVIAPESMAHAHALFESIMNGEFSETLVDLSVQRPDGEIRMIKISIVTIEENGKVVGLQGVARDITEDRAKEQQLRRAEKLASVGTLIGGVAHELNNPLTSLRGFAELMMTDERTDQDRETLELMRRETDRMAKIVSNLKRIAAQTQERPDTREAADLNDIVRHVIRVRRYTLQTSNIELIEDLDDKLPPILANGAEIEQVIINLVVNAEQALATSGGSEKTLKLSTHRVGDRVHLIVSDNGPGIPSEHLSRIFDPFFTTRAPGGGTGLGLSLVHSIVTEHGGHVSVTSRPGLGAQFVVELPATTTVEPPRVDTAVPAPHRPLRILVVDDEQSIRTVLVRYLRKRGHDVDTASEGGEALQMLSRATSPYDVIVSDLRMPGLSGEDLLARLSEHNGNVDRLIFMTGDAAAPSAQNILKSGIPVVMKPFTLTDFAQKIEEHCQRRGR
jgi:PAS domain S-box-containing protein